MIWTKFKFFIFVLFISIGIKIYAAEGGEGRIGAALGGIYWGGGITVLSYDQKGLIPYKNWTIGEEVDILGDHIFILSSRALFWQRSNLSGYYFGPKGGVGYMNPEVFHRGYANDLHPLFVGLGGEAGWVFRFHSGLDAGGNFDLQATNFGLWVSYKITFGYLIH